MYSAVQHPLYRAQNARNLISKMSFCQEDSSIEHRLNAWGCSSPVRRFVFPLLRLSLMNIILAGNANTFRSLIEGVFLYASSNQRGSHRIDTFHASTTRRHHIAKQQGLLPKICSSCISQDHSAADRTIGQAPMEDTEGEAMPTQANRVIVSSITLCSEY